MHLERKLTIRRPADEVFAFITELDNFPRYLAGVKSVRRMSEGPLAVGSRFAQTNQILGQTVEVTMEVAEMVPGRAITLKSVTGLVPNTRTVKLEPVGEGETEVFFALDLEPARAMRLMAPLLERTAREQIEASTNNLRTLLEGEGGARTS